MNSKKLMMAVIPLLVIGAIGYRVSSKNSISDNETVVQKSTKTNDSVKNVKTDSPLGLVDKLSFSFDGKAYTLGPIPAHKWALVSDTKLEAEHFSGNEPFAWASDVAADTKLYDVEGFLGSCSNGYLQDKPEEEGYVHFHGSNENSSVGFWLKHTAVAPFTWEGPPGNPDVGRKVPVGVDPKFPNICEFPAGENETGKSGGTEGTRDDTLEVTDSNVVEISMTAEQWKFTPSEVRVKEGDKVRMTITSLDVTHGFAINEFGVDETIPEGQTVTFEFVADKKGTYRQYCSIICGIGHSGMVGNFIVE